VIDGQTFFYLVGQLVCIFSASLNPRHCFSQIHWLSSGTALSSSKCEPSYSRILKCWLECCKISASLIRLSSRYESFMKANCATPCAAHISQQPFPDSIDTRLIGTLQKINVLPFSPIILILILIIYFLILILIIYFIIFIL
jgi:hypothetical protein